MPFIQKPEGLSLEALELLDTAMTKLWLDHVSTAVGQSGVTPKDLLLARAENDRKHDRLGLRNPKVRPRHTSSSSEN